MNRVKSLLMQPLPSSVAVAVITAFFVALFVAAGQSPPCAGATTICPVASTSTFSDNIGLQGQTAFTITVDPGTPTSNTTWTIPNSTDTAVGLAATQTLTNKTLTSPIAGTQITLDQSTGDYTLTWADPAAGRAISITDPGGTDSFAWLAASQALTNKTYNGLTVTASTGTLTIPNSASLITSGAYSLTLTATGATNVTLPTTGTLATLAGSEALTNKTYNGLTVSTTTGTLTLANGSTLVTSGAYSTTLTATGATTVTLPTTGTLATLAGSETFTNKTLTNPTISQIISGSNPWTLVVNARDTLYLGTISNMGSIKGVQVNSDAATGGSTLQDTGLLLRADYWNGAASTARYASIEHNLTTTGPASQIDFKIAGTTMVTMAPAAMTLASAVLTLNIPNTGQVRPSSGVGSFSVLGSDLTQGTAGSLIIPYANMSGAANDAARDALAGNLNGAIALDDQGTFRLYGRFGGAWKYVTLS